MEEEPSFRFAKRRKVAFRKPKDTRDILEGDRLQSLDTFATQGPGTSTLNSEEGISTVDNISDDELRLSEVKMMLQKRKAARSRIVTVQHSDLSEMIKQDALATQQQNEPSIKMAEIGAPVQTVSSRFAPQTGLYSDRDDIHMAAFVDSEMTKLKKSSTNDLNSPASNPDSSTRPSTEQRALRAEREAATMGLLREVNVEPKVSKVEADKSQKVAQKWGSVQNRGSGVPSNPDRLPKWRKRLQRKDQDVKRDQLVEEFLSENKLDIYGSSEDQGTVGVGDDEAADTMMAEKFEQDFLEAASLRNDARPKPPSKITGKKNKPAEEKPRGPKLGGSRSARAAMHAQGKGQQVRK